MRIYSSVIPLHVLNYRYVRNYLVRTGVLVRQVSRSTPPTPQDAQVNTTIPFCALTKQASGHAFSQHVFNVFDYETPNSNLIENGLNILLI